MNVQILRPDSSKAGTFKFVANAQVVMFGWFDSISALQ
jgi:hypothetical protein